MSCWILHKKRLYQLDSVSYIQSDDWNTNIELIYSQEKIIFNFKNVKKRDYILFEIYRRIQNQEKYLIIEEMVKEYQQGGSAKTFEEFTEEE
jgi:hypothetical protein